MGGTAQGYDAHGNLTSSGSASYAYTARNGLDAVSGSSSDWFYYDAAGRLDIEASSCTLFDYAGEQITGELACSDAHVLRRYVHGAGGEPILWYEGAGTGDRRWLAGDERGSVIAVLDGSGNATANQYDEYGVPQSGNTGRFQYTGQAWLPSAGLYYYKARVYSPTLGRFMQTDPIGYGDGPNWYNYTHSDPVNGTDPTGMAAPKPPGTGCLIPGCSAAFTSTIYVNPDVHEILDAVLGNDGSSGGGSGGVSAGGASGLTQSPAVSSPGSYTDDFGWTSNGVSLPGSVSLTSLPQNDAGSDIVVNGFRKASYLQNPYAIYQPLGPDVFQHILERHFSPQRRASLFRPEWRNLAGQEQLYIYAITHAVPQLSTLVPGAYTLSATFPTPVGWERGTGNLTFNFTVAVVPVGSQGGHTVYAPVTQYPGLP